MTSQTHFRYLYLLNGLAATFGWIYFISDGFQAAGLLDGVYELQAQALAELRLSIEPGPEEVFYFDVCLFNGKYYFYQGLLPAALHAICAKFLGRVVSSYLVAGGFLFCLVYFFQRIIGDITAAALTGADARKRWLKLSPLPCLWLFLFNLPLPPNEFSWFFGRFSIYEQQIIFALAVMMPAIFLLLRALTAKNEQRVCVAVFLCTLAAWTRITWFVFAVLVILGAYFYSAWIRNGKLFGVVSRQVIYWQIASIILLGGLLVLNYLRFDSFLEFGQKHLNPAHPLYLRAIAGPFSPTTKFWNFVFNLFAYYGSPDLVKGLGLMGKSSSNWEYMPASYFYFNPQFLPIFALVPLGLYKAFRKNWNLFLMMTGVGLTAVYMNLLITVAGPLVIVRYFVEFYYFVLLSFFMVIVMLIPCRFSVPAIILLLGVHLPGNIEAFTSFRPELRLVNPDKNLAVIVDETRAKFPRTPFFQKNPVWFKQTVSYSKAATFNKYNAMGVYAGSDKMILSTDMAALYIVPGSVRRDTCAQSALIVNGLKSIDAAGRVRFYVDGRHVGDLQVNRQTAVNGCLTVENTLQHQAPYQIMIIFIPANKKFLPPRAAIGAVLEFREVVLVAE